MVSLIKLSELGEWLLRGVDKLAGPAHYPLVGSRAIDNATIGGVLRMHAIRGNQTLRALKCIGHVWRGITNRIIGRANLEGAIREATEPILARTTHGGTRHDGLNQSGYWLKGNFSADATHLAAWVLPDAILTAAVRDKGHACD